MSAAGWNRRTLAGLLAAGVSSVLLGMPARQAGRAALQLRPSAIAAESPAIAGKTLLAEVRRMDALVQRASVSGRDPFRDPAPAVPEAVRPRAPRTEPAPAPPPSLGALFFDQQDPRVMLNAGAETSNWLRRGEQFHGWTVLEITYRSAIIARNGENVVLHSS